MHLDWDSTYNCTLPGSNFETSTWSSEAKAQLWPIAKLQQNLVWQWWRARTEAQVTGGLIGGCDEGANLHLAWQRGQTVTSTSNTRAKSFAQGVR